MESDGERSADGASRRGNENAATPDELLDIEGVVAAGEFTPDGDVVDFRNPAPV